MWRFNRNSSKEVIARPGDKIIFSYEGKTCSGMLQEVGTKYIRIKEYPTMRKKNSYIYATGKFEIRKINRLAVYPKETQVIGDIYCNSQSKCLGVIWDTK